MCALGIHQPRPQKARTRNEATAPPLWTKRDDRSAPITNDVQRGEETSKKSSGGARLTVEAVVDLVQLL